MNEIEQLIQKLSASGIELWPDGDRLRYRGAKSALSPTLLAQIQQAKPELMAFLLGYTDLPLSYGQNALWFIQQNEPNSPAYNVTFAARIQAKVDALALKRAFQSLVTRHPALRTAFPVSGREPVQRVYGYQEVAFELCECRHFTAAQVEDAMSIAAKRPFDLTCGPLFRVQLFTRTDEEHILQFVVHHIVVDAWSIALLLNELRLLYPAAQSGAVAKQPVPEATYADYVAWQNAMLATEGEQLWHYWRTQLAGTLPVLALPTDRPRPPVQTFQGASYTAVVPKSLLQQAKALAKQKGVTAYMTLLSAFFVLLHRYSKQTDILIGSTFSGRSRAEFFDVVGYFASPLVMRGDLAGNPTFAEFLARVRPMVIGALEHQNYPFPLLVQRLQPKRDRSRSPVFQIIFLFRTENQFPDPTAGQTSRPSAVGQMQWGELSLAPLETRDQFEGQFDLIVEMIEASDSFTAIFKYNTTLFDKTTIAKMATHFETLLLEAITKPNQHLLDLQMYSENERKEQMQQVQQQEVSKLSKLRQRERKGVNLAQVELVKTSHLTPDDSLPLVVEPNLANIDLAEWAKSNGDFIEKALQKYGAMLFRNFNIHSVPDFERFALAVCPDLFPDYGDLPHEKDGEKVYHSTPYPQDRSILFHNESSHMHQWPRKQFFYCVQVAKEGGATPIVDGRKVYQLLRPELREKFRQKKLMYTRNFTPKLDVSWSEFFHTTDKAEVEAYCRKAKIAFEWKEDDVLKTYQIRPAVITHPKTGESVFFNQVQIHHISCLEASVRESLIALFGEENLPRNVYFGDGTPITDSEMAEVNAIYDQLAARFAWQAGDVVVVDNMIVSHGRDPFVGHRKIVVGLGEMVQDNS